MFSLPFILIYVLRVRSCSVFNFRLAYIPSLRMMRFMRFSNALSFCKKLPSPTLRLDLWFKSGTECSRLAWWKGLALVELFLFFYFYLAYKNWSNWSSCSRGGRARRTDSRGSFQRCWGRRRISWGSSMRFIGVGGRSGRWRCPWTYRAKKRRCRSRVRCFRIRRNSSFPHDTSPMYAVAFFVF